MTTYEMEVLIMTVQNKTQKQNSKETSKSNKPKIDRTSIKKTEVVKVVPTKEEKKALILADSQQRAKDTFESFAIATKSTKRTCLDIQVGDVVKCYDNPKEYVTISSIDESDNNSVYYDDSYNGKYCQTRLFENNNIPQSWNKKGTLRELIFDVNTNTFAIRTTTKKRGMNTFRNFKERNNVVVE